MIRVKKILAEVLAVEESELHDAASPETVETWDSFNALMIVSELEREFNVSFTIEEITAVKCVGDIRAALEKHGIELHE